MVNTEAMFYKYLPTKPKLDALAMTLDYSNVKDYNDWPVNLPILRIRASQEECPFLLLFE